MNRSDRCAEKYIYFAILTVLLRDLLKVPSVNITALACASL